MRPARLRQLLGELGIKPKKSLSQNFLIDSNIVRKVVDSAEIETGETVIEIGPGPGALTEELIGRGAHVIAIEKDRALAAALSGCEVHCADFLDFPLDQLPDQFKVVSSLPYQVTTPILTRLAPLWQRIPLQVMIMQDEVARRITAAPGSKLFGSITLFLQFYAELAYLFPIKRTCFYPVPGVDSAVVRLRSHKPPLEQGAPLHDMVRLAFAQRRKMMRKTLGSKYGSERVEIALEQIGAPPTARPEELSLDQFVELWTLLSKEQEK